MIWHSSAVNDIETELDSDIKNGLSDEEASIRLKKYGMNLYERPIHKSLWKHLSNQFSDFMAIILILGAVASIIISLYQKTSYWMEALLMIGIVIFNFIISYIQEYHALKTLRSIKKMATSQVMVKRGGEFRKINTSELVPGDIIYIEKGDVVPADARIIESKKLSCNDKIITSHSVYAEKNGRAVLKDNTPLELRSNMIYAGTTIANGSATAIIVDTGLKCEVVRFMDIDMSESKSIIPSQRTVLRFGRIIGIIALAVCVIYCLIGILVMHLDPIELIMTAIAIGAAIIPESLPVIVSVVVATSIKRMAKRNAFLRKADTVEKLKDINVICTDKTSALTSNSMTVRKAWAQTKTSLIDDEQLGDVTTLLKLGALCCNANYTRNPDTKEKIYHGDPIEVAMIIASEKVGYNKQTLENTLPRIGEIPFDPRRRLMTTLNIIDGRSYAIVKGAPEVILPKCTHGSLKRARNVSREMAADGLSVIVIAYKKLEEVTALPSPEKIENDLTIAGVIGIEDPMHNEALLAVKNCRQMGIRPVLVTGDNLSSASIFARELGIMREGDEAVTGADLHEIDDDTLYERLDKISVYARTSPGDKTRIIKAWKRRRANVAVTGRRLSDIPAMKDADVSCALGQSGKDSIKNSSDVILMDDKFSTLVEAVHYSRAVFDNIRKVIRFLLGCNLGELIAVFTALLVGWGTPLIAIQLLWINLVTDMLPAIALAFEKPEDMYPVKNKKRRENILSGTVSIYTFFEGIMFGALTIGAYVLGRFIITDCSPALGQTMAFAVLAFSQLVHANNVRSKRSLFKKGVFSNAAMILAFILSAGMVLLVMLTPLRYLFSLTLMNAEQWKLTAALSFVPFVLLELIKLFRAAVKSVKARRRRRIEAERALDITTVE